MSSCERCLFRSTYHDMGASSEVCTLHRDLLVAISACERNFKFNDCQFCIYKSDLLDGFARLGPLPDHSILDSLGYRRDKELKNHSLNLNLSLSISRGSCGGE